MKYDPEILNQNAKSYEELIDYLFENHKHSQHILQNGHLAVELKAKAFLTKKEVGFPETHDLNEIFKRSSSSLSKGLWGLMCAQPSNDSIRASYKKIKTAWNMNYRYQKWNYGLFDLKKHYKHYKEVILWIDRL